LKNGVIRKGDNVQFMQTSKEYEVQEVGVMHPEETKMESLWVILNFTFQFYIFMFHYQPCRSSWIYVRECTKHKGS
jgi:hypothetical protein